VVLVVQALLFADGGLTALGLNVLNMALLTRSAGGRIFRLIRGCCRQTGIGRGRLRDRRGAR
jgi:cobalt/nickel transport system permease protein